MSIESCFAFCLVGDLRPVGNDIEIGNIENGYAIAGKTEGDLEDIGEKLAKGKRYLLIRPGDIVTVRHDEERTRNASDALIESWGENMYHPPEGKNENSEELGNAEWQAVLLTRGDYKREDLEYLPGDINAALAKTIKIAEG